MGTLRTMILTTVVLLTAVTPDTAGAQGAGHAHGAPASAAAGAEGAGHAHGAPPASAAAPPSAEACDAEFARVVAEGRGFGLASVADRAGHPGPIHVLELRERLALTPAQVARVQSLFDAMLAGSRPKAEALLAAEARLADAFRRGVPGEAEVRALVADAERRRAELRLAHLLPHLATRAVLTEEQRRLYDAARAGSAHGRP